MFCTGGKGGVTLWTETGQIILSIPPSSPDVFARKVKLWMSS